MAVVVGFHGTTKEIANKIVSAKIPTITTKPGNWLGMGMYFWQDAPRRAFVWAKNVKGIATEQIGIVQAEIDLKHCCDFFDLVEYRRIMKVLNIFERKSIGLPMQDGLSIIGGYTVRNRTDPIANYKDCALIDWYISYLEGEHNRAIDCVRGIFIDGKAVYKESFLFDWAHVQIAVRRPEAIVRWHLAKDGL